MNDIRDLLPGRMRERTFQLKAKRNAGAIWHEPQFVECKQCGRRAARTLWTKSLYVCPNCGYHMPIGGYYRLSLVLDHGSFRELDADLAPQDVLHFPEYEEKLTAAQNKTGLREAAVTATGRIGGVACVAAVLDSRFFMGSMSTAVGDKITRAIEYATAKRLPLVIFSASGGARMQEGIFSLMQMAKTSAAIQRFSAKGGLYVSVLTHPTTGGVTASFASLGDIILAEPGALIGFAGPRVIEQTIGEKLPAGFQRSEFQMEHGFVAINAMVATQDYAAAIRTAVEAGVDAVVSGAGLPLELPGLVNTPDVAIAPIVSSGRAAKLILRRWAKSFGRTADFVVIEGCKAGGHLGFSEEELLAGACQTLDDILPEVLAEVRPYEAQFGHPIPVFVAGGVYTGADMAHFTKLGAAGVQLATRFIPTVECDAAQRYKDVLLKARPEDVRIIHSPVGMPGRALNTPLVQALAEGRRFPPRHCARCLKTCDPACVPYCITHALIEAVKGNVEEGLFFCGDNVGRLDRMYTVRELMDELVTEWRQNA